MVAVFLPLIALAFATIQFEGGYVFFPVTSFFLWFFGTAYLFLFWLPLEVSRIKDPDTGFDLLFSLQNRLQWFNITWIIALQAFVGPSHYILPGLRVTFPQTIPMLVSTGIYLIFLKLASLTFHGAFRDFSGLDQSPVEYFRARMTLPILFFPPMLLWMAIEDGLNSASAFSYMADLWIMAIAPLFFICLYLVSPHLFNWAWRAYPLPNADLEDAIREIANRSSTPIAGVKVWDTFKEPLANAAVAGLAGRYRFVYITQYLLEILPKSDIVAILAHELGHFRLGHVLTYLLFTLDLVFISVAIKLLLFLNFPDFSETYSYYSSIVDPVFFLLIFLLIFTALTRYSERQADRFAASMVGSEKFASALENLQDHIGIPPRKLPWWLETHPDFAERIRDSRSWAGEADTLIRSAGRIRTMMLLIALVSIAAAIPNAKIAWRFSMTAEAIRTKKFEDARNQIDSIEKEIGPHPEINSFRGKIFIGTGQVVNTLLIAAEKLWRIPLKSFFSEKFEHSVSPEVAFQFQIMQFMLKTLDLGGVHRIPLFKESFYFLEAGFSQ